MQVKELLPLDVFALMLVKVVVPKLSEMVRPPVRVPEADPRLRFVRVKFILLRETPPAVIVPLILPVVPDESLMVTDRLKVADSVGN